MRRFCCEKETSVLAEPVACDAGLKFSTVDLGNNVHSWQLFHSIIRITLGVPSHLDVVHVQQIHRRWEVVVGLLGQLCVHVTYTIILYSS